MLLAYALLIQSNYVVEGTFELTYSRRVRGLKVINSKGGKVISVLLPEHVVLQVSSVLLSVLPILISDVYVALIFAGDNNIKVS
jgi:hypothetical protein